MSEYYDHTTYPAAGVKGTSAAMRAELELIDTGFAKLPTLAGNGLKAVVINSLGTALAVTVGTLALAGNFATTGAYNTTLVQQASTSITLPTTNSVMARTDAAQTFTGVQTFSSQPILSSLTASQVVFTDGSKGLVSNAVTGTGNVVMSNDATLVAPVLGTPASGVATNLTGLPLTTGVTGILPTANGGTGIAYFTAAGPTSARIYTFPDSAATILYSGGALGTPSSGVATNLTGTAAGLTAGTASAVAVGGITGLGTGVATALAVNVGSAGAFVTFNGALGTPSSGVLSNLTGTLNAAVVASSLTSVGTLTSGATGSGFGALVGTSVDASARITGAVDVWGGTFGAGVGLSATVAGLDAGSGYGLVNVAAGTFQIRSYAKNIEFYTNAGTLAGTITNAATPAWTLPGALTAASLSTGSGAISGGVVTSNQTFTSLTSYSGGAAISATEFRGFANSTYGASIAGYGGTYDFTVFNKSVAAVLRVPTGTLNVEMLGALSAGAISGTQVTLTGGAGADSTLWKHANTGLIAQIGTGSTWDFRMLNPGGASNIMAVPTGTLNIDFSGTVFNMTTSGTTLTVGVGADNGTVSAGVFTDRTKAFEGDAIAAIKGIKAKGGHIDHASLPAFATANVRKQSTDAKGKVTETIEVERDLGAMISMLTVAVQELDARKMDKP